MKKILIIGGDSYIGQSIYNFLKKKFTIYKTSRKKKSNSFLLDLNWNIKKWPFLPPVDVIICCASISKILECQKKRKLSKKINILGLKNIIKMYKKENNQIIYFSSPHVFSGKNPNPKTRKINSFRKPVNAYGVQKKVCEDIVLKNNGAVIRVSKIVENLGDILTKWTLSLKKGEKIYPFENYFTSLVSMHSLLKLVFFLIKKNKRGIIHLSSRDVINYSKMADVLSKKMKLKKSLIIKKKAPKELNLISGKYSNLFISDATNKMLNLKSSEQVLKSYINQNLI